MKIQTTAELMTTVALGCLSGLSIAGLHRNWHSLGLQAYLSHETKIYQDLYSKEVSTIHEIVLWTFLALLGFAVFKGLSLGIAGILSSIKGTKGTEQAQPNVS